MTEGIHVAHGRKTVEKGALFGQIASIFFILLGPRKVNGPVCDVKIATHHNGFAFAAFFRIGQKGLEKSHLVRHALEAARGFAVVVQFFCAAIGEIAVEKVKLRVFQMQQTALALKFRLGQFYADIERRNLAVHRNARITLFHRAPRPVRLPAFWLAHFFTQLVGVGLGFLQGNNLRICLRKPLPFGLARHRTQAIDIP